MKSINFTFLVAFTFLTSLFFDVEVLSIDCGYGKRSVLIADGEMMVPTCVNDGRAATQAEVRRADPSPLPATQADVRRADQPKTPQSSKPVPKQAKRATKNEEKAKEPDPDKRREQEMQPDNADNEEVAKKQCDNTEGKFICTTTSTNRSCTCHPKDEIDQTEAEKQSPEKPSPAAMQCASELDKYHKDCLREADEAMTSCNDENEAMQAAANAAKTIGAGSVMSIQVACSKINDISKLANEAFAGWKSLCSANQGGCQTNCGKAKEIILSDCLTEDLKETYKQNYLPAINKNIVQCESYKQKLFEAAQHAVAAIAQTKASEQCKKDTTADLNKTINLDQCKINPNTPMCMDMQKCSNPTFAAQNPVCYCVSNPTSPTCLQVNGNFGNKGLSMGATIPGVKNEKGENLPGMNPNGNAEANPFPGFNNGGGHSDGASVGGRQGDAGSAGSGKMGADNGAGNGKGGYGSGNEKDGIKVNSGTYGGGGSGYFGPNYGGAGGGALGGANNPTGARRDIAKFDPRKYIVGQGGQGEYLNGPNGNIFKIMKLRYEENRSTFLPETFVLKK